MRGGVCQRDQHTATFSLFSAGSAFSTVTGWPPADFVSIGAEKPVATLRQTQREAKPQHQGDREQQWHAQAEFPDRLCASKNPAVTRHQVHGRRHGIVRDRMAIHAFSGGGQRKRLDGIKPVQRPEQPDAPAAKATGIIEDQQSAASAHNEVGGPRGI